MKQPRGTGMEVDVYEADRMDPPVPGDAPHMQASGRVGRHDVRMAVAIQIVTRFVIGREVR